MIRYLRAMLIFARHFPLCPRDCPEWDHDDAVAFALFLNSSAGRKLVQLIRYQEQSCNADAVLKKDRHEYASGFAAGFRGGMAWIVSLSEKRTPQSAPTEEDSEPEDSLEHLRP